MTSSNGSIFRVTGPLCGEFTGPGEFPAQRPVTRSFDIFFDLCLNKRLSKQPRGWWFETPSWSLWRHRNDVLVSCNYSLPVFVDYIPHVHIYKPNEPDTLTQITPYVYIENSVDKTQSETKDLFLLCADSLLNSTFLYNVGLYNV